MIGNRRQQTSKDDDLDLLGDEDMEPFSGSHTDFEGAADNLFASPNPCVLSLCH